MLTTVAIITIADNKTSVNAFVKIYEKTRSGEMKTKENDGLRTLAKSAGVFWWQVAAIIGVSESTLIRWLRAPLSSEKKNVITDAIDRLSKERVK